MNGDIEANREILRGLVQKGEIFKVYQQTPLGDNFGSPVLRVKTASIEVLREKMKVGVTSEEEDSARINMTELDQAIGDEKELQEILKGTKPHHSNMLRGDRGRRFGPRGGSGRSFGPGLD